MVYIYVLKLEDNKYYVGKTTNPAFRIENHFSKNGSAWTRKYKPLKIEALIPDCDDYDEDKYTKKYMDKYGIENVRGGSFVSVELDENTLSHLTQMSNGTNDKCFKCGMKGHFTKNCKKNIEYEHVEVWCCDYCNKKFNTKQKRTIHETTCHKNNQQCDCPSSYFSPHRKNKCFLRNMNIVNDKEDEKDDKDEDKDEDEEDDCCFKCGRPGHFASECYAKTDINGDRLDDDECCFKCGRSGHYSTNCYARTDINGKYLKRY